MSDIRVVPAEWDDIQKVFDAAEPRRCQCQWLKGGRDLSVKERRDRFREQATGEVPTGLIAYADQEPAGWVAVEPRIAYPGLRTKKIPWQDRTEDRDDPGVWAVTCFVVRKGFRGRGITYALAAATIGFARDHGAVAVEAYPMITQPGKPVTWGELYVGTRQVFEEAGFTEVTHPSPRRVVMRAALHGHA